MRFARQVKSASPAKRLRTTAFPVPMDTWTVAAVKLRPHKQELDRLEEIISLARVTNCRRIGLAYCAELTPEARLLKKVLQKFFTVKAVPCQPANREVTMAPGNKRPRCATLCDPLAQSAALSRSNLDLIISLGLCVRQDILLKKCSTPPVSTLAVRDQALNHRPLEGLYTGYLYNVYGIQP